MIKVENANVYNWIHAIRHMRDSWESWDRIDSYETPDGFVIIGPNDYDLMMRLSKGGDSHAKYLRFLLVTLDITAPEYWWREYATYKVGTSELSTSQMHKLGSRKLTVDDFSFDDPTDPSNVETVERVNRLIQAWWDAGKKKPSPEWRKLLQNIPQSYNYYRGCVLNYQVLKRIYYDRRAHRLQEWRDFCTWIESLPCSDIITLNNRLTKIRDDAVNFLGGNADVRVVVVIKNTSWWYRVILDADQSVRGSLESYLQKIYHRVDVRGGEP